MYINLAHGAIRPFITISHRVIKLIEMYYEFFNTSTNSTINFNKGTFTTVLKIKDSWKKF